MLVALVAIAGSKNGVQENSGEVFDASMSHPLGIVKGRLWQPQPNQDIVNGAREMSVEDSGGERRCVKTKALGPALAVGTRARPTEAPFPCLPFFIETGVGHHLK